MMPAYVIGDDNALARPGNRMDEGTGGTGDPQRDEILPRPLIDAGRPAGGNDDPPDAFRSFGYLPPPAPPPPALPPAWLPMLFVLVPPADGCERPCCRWPRSACSTTCRSSFLGRGAARGGADVALTGGALERAVSARRHHRPRAP